jgi:hypothetical protein
MPISVKYNNVAITPTPLVSRSYQFIDIGNRFGQVEQIELNCYVTGIVSPTATVSTITALYAGQFKTLEVFDENDASVYKWDNVVLQDIDLPYNSLSSGSVAPYTVKFTSYQIPSGVLDPSNEYSFSQSEDGIVTVTHKVSARGIRTTNAPIDNAISFVNLFVRKNPFTNCPPAFIPNSSGILMNISESLDRTTANYSVSETYKYVTGMTTAYMTTHSLSIDESPQKDFRSIDLSVKLQGSPVDNNLNAVQTAAAALNLTNIIQEYGIATTNIFRDSFTVNQDSGAATVEIKSSFMSGKSSDFDGYFDYTVSMDKDVVTLLNSWRVDGEYISRGPLDYRISKVSGFKLSNAAGGYIPYLKGLVSGSPLYTTYNNTGALTTTNVSLTENSGKAELKLSATFADYDNFSVFFQPKYSIDVEPARWIYEMVPAANIEGHYVIQDLQMKNQSKVKIGFNGNTSGTFSGDTTGFYGLISMLSGIYVTPDSFLIAENISSGQSSASLEMDFIGGDTMGTGFVASKVYGSFGNGYVRQRGYKFGY